MKQLPSLEPTLSTLTVVLPGFITNDRRDEMADVLDNTLRTEGVGRFAWSQQGRRQEELVFHTFDQRATFLVRAELNRLGYDRRALIITDPPAD